MDIINDGIRLNAALEMPVAFKEGDKCPLVVIIHGVTGHMNEDHILAVSHMMNEIGFATLRADMYGHGESEGEYRDHTLYKWITNALAMIDYGRSLDFVTDVFLCGHSQGGLTAMLVAAIKHDQIKGLIPLSPATMIPEACRQGDILQFRFDPKHVPDEVTSGEGRVLDGNYFRVAQQIHVEEAIAGYDGPVLIVHGDADETVPVSCAVEAAAAYKDAKLVVIPGDAHCYDYHMDQMVTAVREWLENFKR